MLERLLDQISGYGRRFKEWVKENPLGLLLSLALLTAILVVVYWAVWADISPEWTGFGTYDEGANGPRAKTLWDWMDLLLVPTVLALGAFLLNRSERKAEREQAEKSTEEERDIARERREQETLEQYFDKMTELLLEWDLRKSAEDEAESDVQTIARARTLAIVRNLSPDRKGNVIQFLQESQLIGDLDNETPAILLNGADLERVHLRSAYLNGAQLQGVNLKGAHLEGAFLQGASLLGANLEGAHLQGAHLEESVLLRAHLKWANLKWANLNRSVLEGANLERANLEGARLEGANLERAHLFQANLGRAHLVQAHVEGAYLVRAHLEGANLKAVHLEGANLKAAQLFQARLQGANLEGAHLDGADLTGVQYDNNTNWPDGFNPEAAGAILVDEDGTPIEEPDKETS